MNKSRGEGLFDLSNPRDAPHALGVQWVVTRPETLRLKNQSDAEALLAAVSPLRITGLAASSFTTIKAMPHGRVEREIKDDTLPGGPRKRTIVYEAPFDRCNRESDYHLAWQAFSERSKE